MTAMFVFAHQDDEFAVLATIERLLRLGAVVRCAYLTDGAFGNQSTSRRNAESLKVLASVGVTASHVHFIGEKLGIRDGTLHANLMPAYNGLLKCIERVGAIDGMYLPAWEGGHQDHDAVHLIGVIASVSLGFQDRTFQFSLYNGYRLFGPLFRVMSPLPENGACMRQRITLPKRFAYARLCLSYPSQWKTWLGLLPFVLFSYFMRGVQQEQFVSVPRLFESPHPGKLLYERRMFLTEEEFDRAKMQFIADSGFRQAQQCRPVAHTSLV